MHAQACRARAAEREALAAATLVLHRRISAREARRETTHRIETRIKQLDTEEQVAYAVAYAPNDIDTHGDFMTPAMVRRAAHDFLFNGLIDRVDVNHDHQTGRARVVESFLAREGDPDFPVGSWVVAVKVLDKNLWVEIKAGRKTGFSIEVLAIVTLVDVLIRQERAVRGTTSVEASHTHDLVLVDDNGEVVAEETTLVAGHSHLTVLIARRNGFPERDSGCILATHRTLGPWPQVGAGDLRSHFTFGGYRPSSFRRPAAV